MLVSTDFCIFLLNKFIYSPSAPLVSQRRMKSSEFCPQRIIRRMFVYISVSVPGCACFIARWFSFLMLLYESLLFWCMSGVLQRGTWALWECVGGGLKSCWFKPFEMHLQLYKWRGLWLDWGACRCELKAGLCWEKFQFDFPWINKG